MSPYGHTVFAPEGVAQEYTRLHALRVSSSTECLCQGSVMGASSPPRANLFPASQGNGLPHALVRLHSLHTERSEGMHLLLPHTVCDGLYRMGAYRGHARVACGAIGPPTLVLLARRVRQEMVGHGMDMEYTAAGAEPTDLGLGRIGTKCIFHQQTMPGVREGEARRGLLPSLPCSAGNHSLHGVESTEPKNTLGVTPNRDCPLCQPASRPPGHQQSTGQPAAADHRLPPVGFQLPSPNPATRGLSCPLAGGWGGVSHS